MTTLFRGRFLEEIRVVALMFWYSFFITCIEFLVLIYVGIKNDLLIIEPCNIVGWDILVSIDVWAHVAIFTHFNCIWNRCGLCKLLGEVAM